MSAIRYLVQIIIILGMVLASACTVQTPTTTLPGNPGPTAYAVTSSKLPSTATPEPTPEVNPAVQAMAKLCSHILPGQVCLVEGPVQVEAQPNRRLMPFTKAGQVLNMADIQRLKLGEAGSGKGLVMLRIQTEWAGSAFTAVAFGDVELVNASAFRYPRVQPDAVAEAGNRLE